MGFSELALELSCWLVDSCAAGMPLDTVAARREFRRCPLFLIADGFVADSPIENGVVEPLNGLLQLREKVENNNLVAARV
jgi:hypothetical protein